MLGSGKKGGAGSVSTGLNSDQDTKLGEESTEESTGRFEVQRLGFREVDIKIMKILRGKQTCAWCFAFGGSTRN